MKNIYIIKIIEICINQSNDYYTFKKLEYVPTPPHSKSSNNKQSLLNTFTSISLLKGKKNPGGATAQNNELGLRPVQGGNVA